MAHAGQQLRRRAGCPVDWRSWALAAAALSIAAVGPMTAIGQSADELAAAIEQSLSGIAYRIDVRPGQAAEDLQEQRRQLELLEQEVPDHPGLPKLRRKFEQLEAEIGQASRAAARGHGDSQVPTAPEAFATGLEKITLLHKEAEAELLRGEVAAAARLLQDAEALLAALMERYGKEVPKGHAPLIVAEEKLAALKDQLADAEPAD